MSRVPMPSQTLFLSPLCLGAEHKLVITGWSSLMVAWERLS